MDRDEMNERSAVRVSAFFKAKIRRLDADTDLVREIETHRTCDRYQTPPTAFSDLPSELNDLTEFQEMQPHIYRMWMTLERKIDYLIQMQNRQFHNDDSMTEVFCIDLSSGGVRLAMETGPGVGDHYLIRIAPPTFPALLIETVGTVVSMETETEEPHRTITAFEFVALHPSDREDLISYLFKRQRELLRIQKGDL